MPTYRVTYVLSQKCFRLYDVELNEHVITKGHTTPSQVATIIESSDETETIEWVDDTRYDAIETVHRLLFLGQPILPPNY